MQTNRMLNNSNSGFTLIEVIISLAIFGLLIGGVFSLLPWSVNKISEVRDRNTAQSLVDAVDVELQRLGFSIVESGTMRLEGLYRSIGEPEDIVGSEIRKLVLVAPRNGEKVSLEAVVETMQLRESGKLVTKEETETPISSTSRLGDEKINFDNFETEPISLNGFKSSSSESILKASNRWIDEGDRYFVLICSQFAKYPGSEALPPSRHFHHPSNGYLALQVEVQWPYKLPGASTDDEPRIIDSRYRSRFSFPVAITR